MTKTPFITADKLEQITAEFPTPFHLYDEKGFVKQHAVNAARGIQVLKNSFAVKATPNPAILKILKEEGCGVDCATDTELVRVRKLVLIVAPLALRLMIHVQKSLFTRVILMRILVTINLDAYEDIFFLEEAAGLPETLSLRFNPGGVFSLGTDIMDHPEESKFGMTKEQLFKGYAYLKEKGVKSFGLHAFLASNTVTNEYYPTLAAQLFELAVEIKNELGVSLDFINLSGGVGVDYTPANKQNDIAVIGEGVHAKFDEILVPNGLGHISIYTELGRFMTAPHGLVVTKVLHIKDTYRRYVGVDASAVNLLRPAMYDAYHHITNMTNPDGDIQVVDVTGSLCENNDKFAKNRELPEARIGDTLVIHDTGAHGFSMGYNYNGRLRSAEILYQEDGTARMIRRAETMNDYFATLDGFDFDI